MPSEVEELDARLGAACIVAREAGALARSYFEKRYELVPELKGLQDPVSVADREVEALIMKNLILRHPEDTCLGEESGGERAESLWVIDPIDGTLNFLRGIPHFAVSIGYMRRGRVEVGVVYDPMMDHLFAARRGGGATMNGVPIRVTGCNEFSTALVGFGYGPLAEAEPFIGFAREVLHMRAEFRRLGSAALMLASVAAGRLDAFFQHRLSAWDVAAGLLLVEEAGGRVGDFFGAGGLVTPQSVIAATPALFDRLKEITGIP